MSNEANLATQFSADAASNANPGRHHFLTDEAEPEDLDDDGFFLIAESFSSDASQEISTDPDFLPQVAPTVLNAFLGGFDSRNLETRRLNDRIVALENAEADLLVENAELASALEAWSPVVPATPGFREDECFIPTPLSLADESGRNTSPELDCLPQVAPAVLEAFIRGFESRESETSRLNERITALEQIKSDLLAESAALASALDAAKSEAAAAKAAVDQVEIAAQAQANDADQTTEPLWEAPPQEAPAVLDDFISGFDTRDSETRSLSNRIAVLEQARSDLIAENAALAGALEAAKTVAATEPEAADDAKPSPTPQSFANEMDQDKSRPFGSLNQEPPSVLNDFSGSFDPWNSETSRLNDKVASLERVNLDLLVENAGLASALEASKRVVMPAPETLDEDEFAWPPRSSKIRASRNTSTKWRSPKHEPPAVIYDFTGETESSGLDRSGSSDTLVVFEPARSNLLAENAMLPRALQAANRRSNFAKIMIALGACLAGFGVHLLGPRFDSRGTGIAIMTIGVGWGLMNLGWFFRPKRG